MARKEKTLDFGHMSVKVHEPTVQQVRNILTREDLVLDPVGFFKGTSEIPTDILELFTDLTQATVVKLSLSELEQVIEEVQTMMRPFSEILKKLGVAVGFLGGMTGKPSTGRPSP
ncbi:MAG: hypothetical protein RBR16_07730 [Syntrophus sp. (in: bacteria)]|nr:hypothetical protein [Syntrophus sp. (in: bacteria)]